jgi:hypothetical protein
VRSSRVRSVTIYINGRRIGVLHGPRGVVAVPLAGRRGQVRVRIVVRRTGGRSIVLRRTYHPCTRGPRRSRSASG